VFKILPYGPLIGPRPQKEVRDSEKKRLGSQHRNEVQPLAFEIPEPKERRPQ
jgi:hypothetical protein